MRSQALSGLIALSAIVAAAAAARAQPIAKCSQDTALRDIDDLLSRGILTKNERGGRSDQLFAGPLARQPCAVIPPLLLSSPEGWCLLWKALPRVA